MAAEVRDGSGVVWHVSDCFSGGVATHVRQLRRLLPELEHRVVQLGGNYDADVMGKPDVSFPRFGRAKPWTWRRIAAEVARQAGPGAVLHGHSTLGGWIVALAARKGGAAMAYTPHAHFLMRRGKAVENAALAVFERALFRGLRGHVVACGTEELALVQRQLPSLQAQLILHAVPPREPHAGRRLDVCFVGRLEAQKRPEAAARILVKSGLRGRLVGSGALEPQVRKALEGQTRVGHVRRVDSVEEMLAGSKALVLTSDYEVGVPYVVLEAWANGAQVFAQAAAGVNDALALGAAFELPGDEDAAAALLADAVRSGARPAVDPRATPYLDEGRMAQEYRSLYRTVKGAGEA